MKISLEDIMEEYKPFIKEKELCWKGKDAVYIAEMFERKYNIGKYSLLFNNDYDDSKYTIHTDLIQFNNSVYKEIESIKQKNEYWWFNRNK